MAQFFTSDHHIGHTNILKHCEQTRPFRSLDTMRDAYVQAWNEAVRPDDIVWYIGDLSLKFNHVPDFLARVNGTKHLLVGNHDVCFKMHPQQVDQYLRAGFASVQRQRLLELQGLTFVLCHFPYRVPEDQRSSDPRIAARQEKFAPVSAVPGEAGEAGLIHGHVHQFWRARVGKASLPELNVAVDAWGGRPVGEAELLVLYRQAMGRSEPGQMDHKGLWGPLYVEPDEPMQVS